MYNGGPDPAMEWPPSGSAPAPVYYPVFYPMPPPLQHSVVFSPSLPQGAPPPFFAPLPLTAAYSVPQFVPYPPPPPPSHGLPQFCPSFGYAPPQLLDPLTAAPSPPFYSAMAQAHFSHGVDISAPAVSETPGGSGVDAFIVPPTRHPSIVSPVPTLELHKSGATAQPSSESFGDDDASHPQAGKPHHDAPKGAPFSTQGGAGYASGGTTAAPISGTDYNALPLMALLQRLRSFRRDRDVGRVVRKLVPTRQQAVAEMLTANPSLAMELCTEQRGIIVCDVFEALGGEACAALFDILRANFTGLATSQRGSLAITRIFEAATLSQRALLCDAAMAAFPTLACDRFANFVVRRIVGDQCVPPTVQQTVISVFTNTSLLLHLTGDKHASHILEAFVSTPTGAASVQDAMLAALQSDAVTLSHLARDPYANYVFQRWLQNAPLSDAQRLNLYQLLRPLNLPETLFRNMCRSLYRPTTSPSSMERFDGGASGHPSVDYHELLPATQATNGAQMEPAATSVLLSEAKS